MKADGDEGDVVGSIYNLYGQSATIHGGVRSRRVFRKLPEVRPLPCLLAYMPFPGGTRDM